MPCPTSAYAPQPDAAGQEGVPDFRETYELPEGLYRRSVPAFDDKVLRELLVNALVHRPYTQRGDIVLNLHPDRLEVVNAGRLPLGVTPQTILHLWGATNIRFPSPAPTFALGEIALPD